MKKLFLLPALFAAAILTLLQSCSKESPGNAVAPVTTNIVNATVATNGSYQLPIDNAGTVTISKQAAHYQLSEAALDNKSGVMVYKYMPALNYKGTDEVVLSNAKTIKVSGGNGCQGSHSSNSGNTAITSISYITVKINIAN